MKKLSKDDLDYIRWRIWEPLRRRSDYRGDFEKLKDSIKKNVYFVDPEIQDQFCKKWKIPYPVDPALSFDQLFTPHKGETKVQAHRRIQGLFLDLYHPEADSAAFVNIADCIYGKYLRLHINLEKSRNQIEDEFKKILDEWLSKDRLEFHAIGKKQGTRLYKETWESRFKVFDLVEKSTSFPKISVLLNIPIDTVYKQYKATWEVVNPGHEYPTRRKREKSLDSNSLKIVFPCTSCLTRECEKTKRQCKRVDAFQKKYTDYSQGPSDEDEARLEDPTATSEYENVRFEGEKDESEDMD